MRVRARACAYIRNFGIKNEIKLSFEHKKKPAMLLTGLIVIGVEYLAALFFQILNHKYK